MDLHHHHHHHHTNANPNLNPNPNPNPDLNPNTNPNRSEAERLLGIAEKLLQTRDLTGSREFALLAQETEPLLEGSDQILAITDVLLASETRVVNNRHHDWYSILQTNPQSLSSDPDLLKKNYRRLALLLHPDKNRYPLADSAFKLVADAWALLSDPSKKGLYDHELNVYSKVELRPGPHQHTTTPPGGNNEKDKLPVRRSPRAGVVGGGGGLDSSDPPPTAPAPHTAPRHNNSNVNRKQQQQRGSGAGASRMSNFWTACPYCYVLYEYPRAYEECCLRCQNCERAFHATVINSLPPMVPGKEAYYCCWGFFPLGFSLDSSVTNKGKKKVDGNNDGKNSVDPGNNNNNNNGPNHNNNNNASQNPNSGFPNWMPAGMFGAPVSSAATSQGGGGGANMNMNVNMNMNASVGGVDISDGSASAGFVFNNNNVSTGFGNVPQGLGNSTPSKKRGRPRKNPLPV